MREQRHRTLFVTPNFIEDLEHWTRNNRKLALRTLTLVKAVSRDPFRGPGKPEPLRGQLSGKWSRRIDHEHRLVYQVDGDHVFLLAARYHY